jgi:hypothetical protein
VTAHRGKLYLYAVMLGLLLSWAYVFSRGAF